MAALWLAQLLCPQRHTICALAYDREATPAATIEAQLHALIAPGGGLNPWCGLCASRALSIEHGKLPYDDWDVMLPLLRETEAANLATRSRLLDQSQN